MEFSVVKLEPRSSFHIGERGVGLEGTFTIIHSDTLFGAICNAIKLLYGMEEVEKIINSFKEGKPPFLISSAFIYVDDIYTLPLPLSLNWKNYFSDFDIVKQLKKIKFITKSIFEDIVQEESNIRRYIEIEKQKDHVEINGIKKGILFPIDEYPDMDIYVTTEIPRVVLDRITNASNIYYFGEVQFSKKCGFYFLIDFRDKSIRKKFKAAINLLGDEGIGGKRSSGKGLFKPKFEKIQFDLPNSDNFVALSLIYPKKDELTPIIKGFYELLLRGGWAYSSDLKDIRRKTIRMIAEGSVLRGKITGKIIDVTPGREELPHQLYRYGHSFLIPWCSKNGYKN